MTSCLDKERTPIAPSVVRVRAGRPTKAAAAERDERLLAIATDMFMEHGFEATSIDGLAEAASIGKATLYARYADKAALFADVLRRLIPKVHGALEDEILRDTKGLSMEEALRVVARRLLEKSLTPQAIAMGRILSAQAPRFPELAELAIREGYGRQMRLMERVLTPYADGGRFLVDVPTAADLFVSLVVGRVSRFAALGVALEPTAMAARADVAVGLFIRGLLAQPDAS